MGVCEGGQTCTACKFPMAELSSIHRTRLSFIEKTARLAFGLLMSTGKGLAKRLDFVDSWGSNPLFP